MSEYVIAHSSDRIGECGVITKVYHNYVRANRALTRSRFISVQIRQGGSVVQENFFPADKLANTYAETTGKRVQVTFKDRYKKEFVIGQVRRAQPVRS